uniref:Vif n=1 Tax=Feline immunodeficiency virus TaxID=11673 RepID=B0LAP4_9RETR|nr:vif [Feline immunodeficiency virus]
MQPYRVQSSRRNMEYLKENNCSENKIKEFKDKLALQELMWIRKLRYVEGILWSFHTREWYSDMVRELVAGTGPLKLYCYISHPIWRRYRPTIEWNQQWPYGNIWLTEKFMWEIQQDEIWKGEVTSKFPPGYIALIVKAYTCRCKKRDLCYREIILGEWHQKWCADCWTLIVIRNTPPLTLQRLAALQLGRKLYSWYCKPPYRFFEARVTPLDHRILTAAATQEDLWGLSCGN